MIVNRWRLACLVFISALLGLIQPALRPAQGASPLTAADRAAIQALLPPLTQTYLKASNTGANDLFGVDIAVDGDTVAIGASHEASNATGSGGDQANNDAPGAGAVYVFVRTDTGWAQQAYLKASNTGSSDLFGEILALSGDTLVVSAGLEDSAAIGVDGDQADNSAAGAGAAYVFTRTNGVWTQQAYLKASNTEAQDWFGWSVAVDGDTIVVGAIHESSNATGVNGDQADNSYSWAGAAYVFERTDGVWSQTAYLKADVPRRGGWFGYSVGVSGTTIVVGAPDINGGRAYVFERVNGSWTPQATLTPAPELSGQFGIGVAIDGDTIAIGAQSQGEQMSGTSPPGAALVYVRTGGTWTLQAFLKPPHADYGDMIGHVVALSGDALLVGAPGDDSAATGINGDQRDNSASYAGAAYLFVRSGTTWSLHSYLKASNTDAGDYFGWALDIDGQTLAVGAYSEDSAATGIAGNQQDNSASVAGAGYLFDGDLPSLATATPMPTATALAPAATATVPASPTAPAATPTLTAPNQGRELFLPLISR